MRGIDGGAHFVIRHELLTGIITGGGNAARGHDLDYVCAAATMLANAQTRLARGVHPSVVPARVVEGGIHSAAGIAVAGGGSERLEGSQNARSVDMTGRDRMLDGDRIIAATQIAHRRETLLQHGAGERGAFKSAIDI